MSSRTLTIALIGAGPVGTSVATHARRCGYVVTAVISGHAASARRLARRVGCRTYGTSVTLIPPGTQIVVLAVPDTEIERVATALTASVAWSPRTSFVHTSGTVTSDALATVRARGHRVASLHPIQTFPRAARRFHDPSLLDGIAWGVEASSRHRTWFERFIRRLRGRPVRVPKESKIAYHMACTFASNYPVLLWQLTAELGRTARIQGGLGPFMPLILESLGYAYDLGPRAALTGPAARGDRETLRKHRAVLRRMHPAWVPLFDALVRTVRRTSR